MGGRFLAVPDSLAPVMRELKKRGLVYLEDGSVAQSTAPAIAQETGLPMRRASMVIDAKPDAESIRAALDELVREAEKNGFAIGIGAGLEVTIETVGEFARELQERGVLLVPISATFKGQMG
ncbi:MAG: divergent polysaccharide deacetylase family protein, partial [Aestuariivirga sp.]